MNNLTAVELEVIRKVITSSEVQSLMGAGEWDLTEDEENILLAIIEKVEDK
jgi:hypothetical protein